MQSKLGIMFSEYECEEMVKYLDEDGSGSIELNEFIQKLQNLIYKGYPKDKWVCTKSMLIQVIAEEY